MAAPASGRGRIMTRSYPWATVSLLTLSVLGHSAAVCGQQIPACCAGQPSGHATANNAPLTNDQIRDLVTRVLENQHRNDLALVEFQRTQHVYVRGNGKDIPDKVTTSRVVPAGASLLHVELERNGKPTDRGELEQQWRAVEKTLLAQTRGDERATRLENEQAAKKRDRADLVAGMGKAFRFRWVGRETVNGKSIVELAFEPEPSYKSSSRYAPLYAHSTGMVWISESSAQLVRLVAELTDDVYFAGGLIAKVYRGSRFTFEQAEVSPGIWLPLQHTYDFDGRKFLFAMNIHEKTEYTDYRRVAGPEEAVLLIRSEHLTGGKKNP